MNWRIHLTATFLLIFRYQRSWYSLFFTLLSWLLESSCGSVAGNLYGWQRLLRFLLKPYNITTSRNYALLFKPWLKPIRWATWLSQSMAQYFCLCNFHFVNLIFDICVLSHNFWLWFYLTELTTNKTDWLFVFKLLDLMNWGCDWWFGYEFDGLFKILLSCFFVIIIMITLIN